jgi:hypothetical protein
MELNSNQLQLIYDQVRRKICNESGIKTKLTLNSNAVNLDSQFDTCHLLVISDYRIRAKNLEQCTNKNIKITGT